ncbi:MAG: ATP-binding protein, partial [Lachnospiraceae bacterium]|nr:ATP-binding protein [Lachnospiraceae bacterium]
MMEKFFNTAGPCKPDLHYMVDPLWRIDFDEIMSLIRQQRYFVLHAPRQTGKTTSLLAMVEAINAGDEFACVYVNVEAAQTARSDVKSGMGIIAMLLGNAIKRHLRIDSFVQWPAKSDAPIQEMLTALCQEMDRPLVLFIDEIDSLVGDTLVSVLRQLRGGYDSRPALYPISVILCGVRDVRDYRIHQSDGEIITGGSCFNV